MDLSPNRKWTSSNVAQFAPHLRLLDLFREFRFSQGYIFSGLR